MASAPPQTPLDRLAFSITNTHGLDPQLQANVLRWLRGAPLTDPQAIAYVKNFFPDLQVQASGVYHPGPITGVPAPGSNGVGAQPTPVSGPPRPPLGVGQAYGALQLYNQTPTGQNLPSPSVSGTPQARAGVGPTEGGLYQAYTANQRAAASRPIAENPIKGPNAGDNVTPAPPVTAATTPNATNPTAPNPANSSSTGGSVMATPPPVPSGNPNDLATVSGAALVGGSADQGAQLREALRQAGYDPDHLGLGGQFFAKLIQPTLAAEASVYGFGNPGGADPTKAQDFIGNLVRSFTTRGVNGAAQAAQYAQGIMGNPAFQQTLGDLPNDQQRQQVLQNLAGLVYGNRSSLEQSAAAANFDRALSQFQDAGYGLGGVTDRYTGNFSQWLTTPAGQRLARMIGLGG